MSRVTGPAASPPPASASVVKKLLLDWFATLGWKPFGFQRDVWKAVKNGESGLLHATTGAGKTYAVWLAALQAFAPLRSSTPRAAAPPLTVLWLTPMRALAADTVRALQAPLDALESAQPGAAPWTVGARTGDTASSERSAQSRRLPSVLVTTPESLSVLLSRADAKEVLGTVRMVVVDEWHELLGNKRGVQVQLAIARLRAWRAVAADEALSIWGMSATLGNLNEAMTTLLGHPDGTLVQGQVPKKLVIDSLLPATSERFAIGNLVSGAAGGQT